MVSEELIKKAISDESKLTERERQELKSFFEREDESKMPFARSLDERLSK